MISSNPVYTAYHVKQSAAGKCCFCLDNKVNKRLPVKSSTKCENVGGEFRRKDYEKVAVRQTTYGFKSQQKNG